MKSRVSLLLLTLLCLSGCKHSALFSDGTTRSSMFPSMFGEDMSSYEPALTADEFELRDGPSATANYDDITAESSK